MKNKNPRYLLLSLGLLVVFGAVGFYATSSSSYIDVSKLIHMKPGTYMVRGDVQSWTVQNLDGERYLVLVLKGKEGDTITALVPVSYIERKYGPLSQVIITNGEMVVKGYWNGKVLKVSEILKGCHSAYNQPVASS